MKYSLRLSLPQAESPTRAAERAAAAWTPPPASTAAHAVDQVRARPRRSASSYAAYTAADTAAFEAAFGAHLAPPKDVSPPAASPARVRVCLKSDVRNNEVRFRNHTKHVGGFLLLVLQRRALPLMRRRLQQPFGVLQLQLRVQADDTLQLCVRGRGLRAGQNVGTD